MPKKFKQYRIRIGTRIASYYPNTELKQNLTLTSELTVSSEFQVLEVFGVNLSTSKKLVFSTRTYGIVVVDKVDLHEMENV